MKIQFQRLIYRQVVGESVCISGSIKGSFGCLLDLDMVRMPVSADWIKGDHHLRFEFANIVHHISRHFFKVSSEKRLGV